MDSREEEKKKKKKSLTLEEYEAVPGKGFDAVTREKRKLIYDAGS